MARNRHLSLLVVVLLVASIFRLWNLEWNPAWYTDEGSHIEIARHLIHGKNYYLGITDSYLIVARLPLFEHLLAFWFHMVGEDMFTLRIMTSFMGILTTALTYRVAKTASHDRFYATSCIALFTIYPQAVIYSRFGFSYNLLPMLILLAIWGLVCYRKSEQLRYAIFASFLFGLATVSDFIAFTFLPSLILIVWSIRPRHTIYMFFILLSPFAMYSIIELFNHPDIFIYDLSYTLSRTGGLALGIQARNVFKNIEVLLSESWWILGAVIGLIWIKSQSFRWMVTFLLIPPIIISGRTVALYDLSAYYMIPFLPLVIFGVSALLVYGIIAILLLFSVPQKIRIYVRVISLSAIFIVGCVALLVDIHKGFEIGIEHFLIDAGEANTIKEVAIDYAKESDIIIVSPALAWMFDGQVTDFQLASLRSGQDTVHFPADLYPDRFSFDLDRGSTIIAIVDNLWRDWGAVHIPAAYDQLTEIVSTWELIHQTNTIQVYQSP